MLNLTRRLGLVSAVPLVAACAFLAFAGCAGGVAPPVTTSQAASLALRSLPASERNGRAPKKIYVVNAGNNTLTTYKYDGTPTIPTITDSISDPQGVAVDRNGKIYVANGGSGLVTTYDRFGNRTNPTIDVSPWKAVAVAVDANGKIYVGTSGKLLTYNPDGSRTTPTIQVGNPSLISWESLSTRMGRSTRAPGGGIICIVFIILVSVNFEAT